MKNKIDKLLKKFKSIKMSILLQSASILISAFIVSLTIIFGTGSVSFNNGSANQATGGCSGDNRFNDDCLVDYAKELDLDDKKFGKCVQEQKFDEVVASELQYGEKIGINSTPSLYIGKKLDGKIKAFYLGGAGYSEIEDVLGRLEKESIENVNKYWTDTLLQGLGSYEEQVRQYYASPEGGALTGQELETEVAKIIEEQKASIQTEYVIKDLEIGKGEVMGDAEIVLMEFSDYECPFCKDFSTQVLPDVKKNFVEGKRLQYVFRDFPLETIHPKARAAANAARCAGEQGKYFEYHDKLFSL